MGQQEVIEHVLLDPRLQFEFFCVNSPFFGKYSPKQVRSKNKARNEGCLAYVRSRY